MITTAKVKGSYDFELSKIQPVSWAVRRCQAATTGSQTESTRGKAPLSHGQTTASTSLISRTQMKACTTHLSVATQRWQVCWNRSSRQLAPEWMQRIPRILQHNVSSNGIVQPPTAQAQQAITQVASEPWQWSGCGVHGAWSSRMQINCCQLDQDEKMDQDENYLTCNYLIAAACCLLLNDA